MATIPGIRRAVLAFISWSTMRHTLAVRTIGRPSTASLSSLSTRAAVARKSASSAETRPFTPRSPLTFATSTSRSGLSNRSADAYVAQRAFSSSAASRQAEQAAEAEREPDDGEKNIIDILKREFQPANLHVQDVSGGCGSFYAIVIASHKFKGVPTIKAHRMVNEALKDIISGIHGLQLRTSSADEPNFG